VEVNAVVRSLGEWMRENKRCGLWKVGDCLLFYYDTFLAEGFQNLGLGLEISTKNNKLGLCFSCNYFFPVSRFALRYVVPLT